MYYSNLKGHQISLLGMGCMRFASDDNGNTDKDAAIRTIRKSIDHGITYVDTAYMYHNGESEKILGMALKDGYREKVLVADKIPPWYADTPEDLEEIFHEHLERLDLDTIDVYLIHDIHDSTWETVKKLDVLGFMERKRAEGKIRYIGFSFHGEYPLFEEVLDAYPWDLVQIQYNYLDEDFQAGRKGLEYARSKGVPVVIMEPLKGGKLAGGLPPEVDELWKEMSEDRLPVDWAFSWVASQPGILTILSGMSDSKQVEQNLALFEHMAPGCLTEKDRAVISKIARTLQGLTAYDCTACKYCMPCPKEIDIPKIIDAYNQYCLFENNQSVLESYEWRAPHFASTCVACKRCEKICPQGLPISQIMEKTAEAFGK